jgi:hypothetical protein
MLKSACNIPAELFAGFLMILHVKETPEFMSIRTNHRIGILP